MFKLNAEYLEETRADSLLAKAPFAELGKISATTYLNILKGVPVTGRVVNNLIKALKLDKERLLNSTH